MNSRVVTRVKAAFACLAFVLCSAAAAQERIHPDEIEGLEAWYKVGSLQGKLGEKNAVTVWPDASGRGHDLKRATDDRAGTFREAQINDRSVVGIEAGEFAVESPFELNDHTVFVVARAKYGDQALFRSEENPTRGVMLYQGGTRHLLRSSGVGSTAASYSDVLRRESREFAIITLARKDGVLRAWMGGRDVSSWARLVEPLTVGTLFNLKMSTFVDRDARGLEVAEMLFYERFLGEEERQDVSAYLADRFQLPLAESVALSLVERIERLTGGKGTDFGWLRSADTGNLNDPAGHRVAWHGHEKRAPYLRHEATEKEKASRIYGVGDGVRLYLYLALPVTSHEPGIKLRTLVLRNGREYLPGDSDTPAFGGSGDAGTAMIELETVVTLSEGDYIEIVIFKDGAEGEVKLVPGGTGLVFENRAP
jgi:hypothetical protein